MQVTCGKKIYRSLKMNLFLTFWGAAGRRQQVLGVADRGAAS